MRETVLKVFHESNLVCHIGRDKRFRLIKNRFFLAGNARGRKSLGNSLRKM